MLYYLSGMVPLDIFPTVLRVLDLIGQGHTLTSACAEANISYATFRKYVKDTPELSGIYVEAEQRGFDTMADALINFDTHPVYAQTDPKKAKILSDNIKWYLSRKRPDTYGDKVVVQHDIRADEAIINALERGKQRAIAQAVIEDVTYSVVSDIVKLPAEKPVVVDDGLDFDIDEFR